MLGFQIFEQTNKQYLFFYLFIKNVKLYFIKHATTMFSILYYL